MNSVYSQKQRRRGEKKNEDGQLLVDEEGGIIFS